MKDVYSSRATSLVVATFKGKEVGFSLSMKNPKKAAKNNTVEVDFNRALQQQFPDVLTNDQVNEVEMASINVEPDVQAL